MIKEIDEEEEKQIEEEKKKKQLEEEKKAKEAEEENNVIKESKSDSGDKDDPFKKLKEGPKKINLLDIDEGKSVVSKENEGTRRLLAGFKQANVKIHLLTDDLEKIFNKQKYADLFDIAVLSIHSANRISEEMNTILKNKAKVHVETCDNLCVLKKEQRSQFR